VPPEAILLKLAFVGRHPACRFATGAIGRRVDRGRTGLELAGLELAGLELAGLELAGLELAGSFDFASYLALPTDCRAKDCTGGIMPVTAKLTLLGSRGRSERMYRAGRRRSYDRSSAGSPVLIRRFLRASLGTCLDRFHRGRLR
jgi:hypothetical protein